jgi:hypothetical protein
MRLAAACIVLIATAHVASAEQILVLRADGRADKAVRLKVEAAVLKLATQTGSATAGDVTYVDAAMMVGCKPDEDSCKDQVLDMLAVEEIVTISTTPKPGGIEVAVRRVRKGATTKSVAVMITPDKADQLDALDPMFVKEAPPPSTTPPPLVPAVSTQPPTEPLQPAPAQEPTPSVVVQPLPAVTPEEPDDGRPHGTRRLAAFGMIGGGAMVVVGVVFWASASNIEDEITAAPKRTRADIEHVRDLEAQGDTYATAGNVLAVGGLILGGVSTYFFLKSGKRKSHTAQVTPILGHGTGMAITWGGSL